MKFYIHKLGCPKNDVDADYIAARLVAAGHEPVADPEQAESVIVNTCGFILPAKEESIETILRLGQLKKRGGFKTLYVSGCLAQRYHDELLKGIPELDGVFGLGALDALAKALDSGNGNHRPVVTEANDLTYTGYNHRYVSNDYPYAYLKISDGCNRRCTYCAIPGIRGKYRSRPLESIVAEAEYLAQRGKKELILVSQEATLYGYDLKGQLSLMDLLRALDAIEGVRWIRVMYLHPAQLDRTLIEYFADDNKTLDYFDLPLQHINSDLLSAMGRAIDRPEIERLLGVIRSVSPTATLRTTFIVGFPGETDQRFAELKDFVAEYEFDRLGVFTYSPEEGTPAASMPGQIPEKVKAARRDELMTLQSGIVFAKNESLIGSIQEVIIDSIDGETTAVGRMRSDCPEVDLEVTVCGHGLAVGDIVEVRIDAVDGYDLRGTKVEA
jgi:ribosomal protein S12 methylthiotransferase